MPTTRCFEWRGQTRPWGTIHAAQIAPVRAGPRHKITFSRFTAWRMRATKWQRRCDVAPLCGSHSPKLPLERINYRTCHSKPTARHVQQETNLPCLRVQVNYEPPPRLVLDPFGWHIHASQKPVSIGRAILPQRDPEAMLPHGHLRVSEVKTSLGAIGLSSPS